MKLQSILAIAVVSLTVVKFLGNDVAWASSSSVVVTNAYVYTNAPKCCTTTGLGPGGDDYGFSYLASGNNGDPSISAAAQTYKDIYGNHQSGGGFADLIYFYRVTGGTPGVYVPITLTGSVSATDQIDGSSRAILDWSNGGVNIKYTGSGQVRVDGAAYDGQSYPASSDVKTTYEVLAGAQLDIYMQVYVDAVTGGYDLLSHSYASADPVLT